MRKSNRLDTFDKHICHESYRLYYDTLFDINKLPDKRKYLSYAHTLENIEYFVDDLLSDSEIPFVPNVSLKSTGVVCQTYHASALAQRYFIVLPDYLNVVNLLSSDYEHSERINTFIHCCQSMGLLGTTLDKFPRWDDSKLSVPIFNGKNAAELFNTLVADIRHQWKISKMQVKVNARKNEATKRFNDYCNYVDAMFDSCAALLVLTIDLFYQKQYANTKSIFDITQNLNHLLENKRCNSLFCFMKGYIAKLEYSIEKGFHFHVLLFFDDSKRDKFSHIYFTKKIGEYWAKVITKGQGDYWSVNDHTQKYNPLGQWGIGSANWKQDKIRANLKQCVIEYFCMIEQFIRPKFGSKVKLLRRGNFPKVPVRKRGRPYKIESL